MSRIELRPMTAADVAALIDEPLPYRVRGYAAVRGDELLGVGGLAYLPGGAMGAFLLVAAGVDRRAIAVSLHKAGKRLMADAKALGFRRVVALAQDDLEPAERWLERLGFSPEFADGDRIFVWKA